MFRSFSKNLGEHKGVILRVSVLLLAISAAGVGVYATVPRVLQIAWPLTTATGASPGASIIPLEINHQGVIRARDKISDAI
jgi:hypothetical protein